MNYTEYSVLRTKDPKYAALKSTAKADDWDDFKRDRNCTWCGHPKVVCKLTGEIACIPCGGEDMEKFREAKELEERINTPKLDFLESAKIAKQAIEVFPTHELDDLIDFFEGQSEIRDAISLMHDTLKPKYRELIERAYKNKGISNLESIDADTKQSMERGMTAILRKERIAELLIGKKDSLNSEKIEKTHSWQDLKASFDGEK